MPELPEVQTIITDLNQKIKGDTIVDFFSDWSKAIKNQSAEKFTKEIKNRKILDARRIGKNIFLDLSGEKTLYIHLKMTGHLLVKSKDDKLKSKSYFKDRVNQYIHHIWYLKSGRTLEFSDLRKFGKIVLGDTEKINNLKEIKALGVDAMSAEFNFIKFSEILDKKNKMPIGILLMDQNLISGIGNIYRSEILFDAGIHPLRKTEKINKAGRKKIFISIIKILKKAIKLRGTSDSDYRDTSGAPGNFQKITKVYRREKQKCRKCGTIIKRLKIGQRSAFVCEKCQK
jgi:formamidopyrimidine-DNA glycosylase